MAKKAEKPQHAPSAKLALDDVLKSLQDLIRNDLTEGAPDAAGAAVPAPAEMATELSKPPSTKEVIQELEAGLAELSLPLMDPATPAAAATPISQEDTGAADQALVLPESEPSMTPPGQSEFLQDTTPAPVDIAPLANLAPVPHPMAGSEFLQDEPPMDSEIASLDNVTLDFGNASSTEIEWDQRLSNTPESISPAPSLARTVELALPSFVPPIKKTVATPVPQATSKKKMPATSPPPGRPQARGRILTQGLQAELPLASQEPPAPPAPAQPGLERANWDDIPVLQDAIDVPETPAAAPAAHAIKPQDQAHRMAIQIAARLNVELRRAGKPPLSSDIVTRLVHLLQETLAQGAPNVDNKPQRKDG